MLALQLKIASATRRAAVLAAGGDARAGVASGVNNATSRVAGLVATALLGPVLASGDEIVAAFGAAALVGAGAALGAAAAALLLVRKKDRETRQRTTPT